MNTGPSTAFFDLLEVTPVVSVGLGLVVVRDCVEARCLCTFPCDNVRHADNRRRVEPSTKFGEDRRVGTQPAPHRLPEDMTEVLFVFSIGSVADARFRAEAPEALNRGTTLTNADELARWNFANLTIRRQVGVGIVGEVS